MARCGGTLSVYGYVDMIGVVGRSYHEWPVDTGGREQVGKAPVSAGQTDWNIGTTEWDVYAQNTFGFTAIIQQRWLCTPCTTPDDITVEPDAGGTTALVSWTAVDGGTVWCSLP